jgi:hypothetical protein
MEAMLVESSIVDIRRQLMRQSEQYATTGVIKLEVGRTTAMAMHCDAVAM